MVRNYKRKREDAYNEETLRKAIADIKENNIKVLSASSKYNIPRSTLRYWVNRELPDEHKKGRFQHVFNNEQREELREHILKLQRMFYGISGIDVRRLAFQYAEAIQLPHSFNKTKKMAGKDWLISFNRMEDLSFRTPEATSMARVAGFTKEKVERFFRIFLECLTKYQFPPSRIFNIDETGLSIVQKPRKIIAQKGAKQIGRITSAERGKNITMIGTISATGTFIPPFLIYPRVRMNPQLSVGTFPNTSVNCNASGWSDGDLFLRFLEHFVKCVLPSKEKPVMLLLDGHGSHKTLNAINFCRENGIFMITFPPHTSHKLQPLDVGVFGPFKAYLSAEMDNYMTNHPGERITDYVMGPLIKEAFIRAFCPKNIIKGFEKSGIYPYNNNIFEDHEYIGATAVLSHPAAADSQIELPVDSKNRDEGGIVAVSVVPTQEIAAKRSFSPQPGTSKQIQHLDKTNFNLSRTPEKKKINIIDISPIPTARKFDPNKKPRKQEQSEEITASPYKLELEIKMTDKQKKQKVTKIIGESNVEAKEKKGKKRERASKKIETEDENIYCPYCGEKYGLTQEEWIQCGECKQWSHEDCTDFEKEYSAIFICDLCRK